MQKVCAKHTKQGAFKLVKKFLTDLKFNKSMEGLFARLSKSLAHLGHAFGVQAWVKVKECERV